jgi:hypothetical protein
MNTSESFRALHRANPRSRVAFEQAVESVRSQIGSLPPPVARRARRGHVLRVSAAGAAFAVAAVVAVSLIVTSRAGGPGVESAAAAIRKAATLTAASAERSGTAVVRMTHDGRPWAGKTVRWKGSDMAIVGDGRLPRSSGGDLRVVDGILYSQEADGGWASIGPETSIDPGSGTTPAEQLASVREDVGGATLSRITRGMTGLTTSRLPDGSTVYRGRVAARLIARETGFKEGQAIRVFPFGYVAHDQAADPGSLLDTAVTVGSEGVVREIAVTWGTWTYTVSYSGLGSTPAPVAPANARPLDRTP